MSYCQVPYGGDVYDQGGRILTLAVRGGHLDVVGYLIGEKKMDVDENDGQALTEACQQGNLEMVRELVERYGGDG